MKRICYLFLSLFLCLLLVACEPIDNGNQGNQGNQEPQTSIKDDFDCITIAEALELAKEAGSEGTKEKYYVYGIIEKIESSVYGAMTITDETGSLYVYGVYSKDGETRYDAFEDKPVEGDEIVLYGILKTYNDEEEMDRGFLQAFKHIEKEIDDSEYVEKTISEARTDVSGTKVKLTGVVARITYAFGMVPNGFYLVDNTGSIYVYGKDSSANVKIGNTVTVIGEKTYYILENEISAANKHGYQGCCQIQNVTVLENDKQVSEFDKSWIEETTIKDIMETSLENNITTNIYKVKALVKKVEGTGFTNYYFNDLDGYTGSYTYTSCSGSDFTWLDEFDNKICTVYLSVINAKSTSSGCIYRFVPILVIEEEFTFDFSTAADFAIKYYLQDQFLSEYEADPELEVLTSVSNDLFDLSGLEITYSSNNEEVAYFEIVDEKVIFHVKNQGNVTITIEAKYQEFVATKEIEISVVVPTTYETITVKEAIETADDTEVIVKGIVLSSLVNQTGFYLIDETGVIAVTGNADEISLLSVGDEVIVKGTKDHKVKDGYTGAGQINIYNSTILANYYGNHEYSTDLFIKDKTMQELYDLSHLEDHSTEVYVVKAIVEVVETGYYTSIKIKSTDGNTTLSLYCSSANQYSFLKPYNGQEVELELAMCNWNSKTYYACCVISVSYNGQKTMNTLNFTSDK